MIIGQKRQIEYFKKVIAKDAFAHAYVFFGPAHVGKRTIAENIARTLLCEKGKKEFGGCGSCAPCRKMETHVHENVLFISREETLVSKKETRKEIPIEDIREIKRVLSFTGTSGRPRIIILDGAERLSQEAANAFLKLLEEPPRDTLFFLITSEIEGVIPTIRSRARPIYFSLVDSGEIGRGLPKVPKTRHDDILVFAAGRPGVALSLAENDDAGIEMEKMAREIAGVLKKGAPFVFSVSEKYSSEDDVRQGAAGDVIRILEARMLREENVTKQKGLAKRLKNVVRITDAMSRTNVNPRLSLDLIFIEGSEGTG